MPATSGNTPKGWATGASGFTNWLDVRQLSGASWKYASRVFRCTSPGNWVEVWNNRPVTVTGSASSSAYDSITLTGTVDPNNFATTPRFYYKKSTDATYTAGSLLTVRSGDSVQAVEAVTITGLVENTVYNYYLSATSAAGTSDTTVQNITTQVDCRQLGLTNGWSGTNVKTYPVCECSGTFERITTTWKKPGCEQYDTVSNAACVGGCNPYDTNCYNAPTGETKYQLSCASRESRILYTFTAKPSSGCSDYSYYTAWVAAPTCEGACTTVETVSEFQYNGKTLYTFDAAGNYVEFDSSCRSCPEGCWTFANYYVTLCNGVRTVTLLSCDSCTVVYSGAPC